MKNLIRLLFLMPLFLTALTACTGNEGAAKEEAIKGAQSQFDDVLNKEAQDNIPSSDWMRDAFTSYIHKVTEWSTDSIQMQGDNDATVTVIAETVALKPRQTAAVIAGRLDKSAERNFNFANALGLIAQQTGTSPEKVKIKFVIKVHKSGDHWVAAQ